jgi:hypothetical protein
MDMTNDTTTAAITIPASAEKVFGIQFPPIGGAHFQNSLQHLSDLAAT